MEPRASHGTGRRPASPPTRPSPSTAPFGPEDFPGCEPFHLPESELERYEGRLEFWDGRTHTAWRVCEPTTLHHEGPTQMLAQVAERFAGLRGSPIKCFGSADLVRWEASGTRRWLMQADQVLYLHPGRSRPSGRYIDVDRDPLPDVVLEVDYTTDVRRRKLSIYEEGGFPEVWVLAPPGSRLGWHRLTIYALGSGGAYHSAPESGAIPGWKREEIHDALVEELWSEPTWRAVERVALAMGAREGTRPEDDPLSRTLIRRGEARGRREERAEMVRTALLSRGIEASPRLEEELMRASDVPAGTLMAAALGCASEADLLRRVHEAARQLPARDIGSPFARPTGPDPGEEA